MTKLREHGYSKKYKCIYNDGYPASLTLGKVYWGKKAQRGALAIFDNDNDTYAYNPKWFEVVDEENEDEPIETP